MSIFGLLLQPKQKRMIFYFSGTGNSKWVARQVAAYQHESLIAIADELAGGADLIYTLQPSEVVGFVFPVYSWAPPAIVMEFISKIRFTNAEGHYFFFVCTCGDEAGLTLNIMNESVVVKVGHGKRLSPLSCPTIMFLFPDLILTQKKLSSTNCMQL